MSRGYSPTRFGNYGVVIDSYTGIPWCGAGLHLLDERYARIGARGERKCKPCEARHARERRAKRKSSLRYSSTNPETSIADIASGSPTSEVGDLASSRRPATA